MSKETTRTLILLETGKQLFLAKGYSSTGIEAVVQAAGVPKGSFYYYFGSKEEFGLQVIDRFAEEARANFERCQGEHEPAAARAVPALTSRRSAARARSRRSARTGCLVGNLSQEMAAQSEAFRIRLEEIFEGVIDQSYAAVLL